MNEKNAPRTVIGPDTVINGEIHSRQDLVIQGRVEGALQVDAVLFIETGGTAEAEVTANHAVVAGSFQGSLTAVDVLEIAETGRVRGDVTAPRMLVADGAVVNAEIRMGGGAGVASGDAAEETADTRPSKTDKRTVYSYTVPAETAAEVVETEPVEVVKAAAPKAKKGGRKKKG